jgi:hypothetical protein
VIDRFTSVLAGLVMVGLGMIAFGAIGVSSSNDPTIQLPYAVSGGLGGLALIGLSLGLLLVHDGRRDAAVERAELERLARAVEGE